MASAGGSGGPFLLSATLAGHQADVRTICDVSADSIATGSLDQLAKLWTSVPGTIDFECTQTYQGHNRYIYSIAYIPPTAEFARGLIATASVDTNVHLYLPDVGDGPVRQLIGPDEAVLTSSWDGTAKVWGLDGTCRLTLEGHTKSVLAIIAHPTPGMYVTCSADLTIRIWNRDACQGAMTGHTDVPRDLAILHDGTLVSCANDGSVKMWNLERPGPCIRTMSAHAGCYIYSIAVFPPGSPVDFATGGEDGTVTVWRGANKVQSIAMPCNSVWAVAARANGDLLVACNDGMGRVLSRDPARQASDDVIASFIEHVAQVALARAGEAEGKIGDLDTSNLVGVDRLASPGEADGQIIMVRDGSKVMAHSWSSAENAWQTIGEVSDAVDKKAGPAPPGWQHFDVELDSQKMVCRHKTGDNPFVTAQRFLDENLLDQSLLDQVVEFVERNAAAPTLEFAAAPTAPTVPGAYVPGRAAAAAQHPPRPSSLHFPITELVMMSSVKLDGLEKMLTTLNVGVSPELQLDGTSIQTLMSALSAAAGKPSAPLNSSLFDAVAPMCAKLLSWPAGEARVPGLDAVRVLIANSMFRAAAFAQEGTPLSLPEFKGRMLRIAALSGDGGPPESAACQMLALRALANAFGGDVGMHDCVPELLPLLERFDAQPLTKHAQIALATVLLNSAVSTTRRGDAAVIELGGELLRVLGHSLAQLLRSATPEPEALYRVLAAIGTLVVSSEVMVAVALSLPEVTDAVQAVRASSQGKVAEAATDVQRALRS